MLPTSDTQAKPFLKWVGGKKQLLPQLEARLPAHINTYYEPFIGGGALFFHLANAKRFKQAALSDWNPELVNAYTVIRDSVDALVAQLAPMKHDREFFESIRASEPESPVLKAARTLYLNRTGFNGLYRLNKKGKFNVPFGKYKNPKILNEENLRACSQVLAGVQLLTSDFSRVIEIAQPGDVVYFDPPYVPVSATSSFLGYTSDGFSGDDQKRLSLGCRELHKRGVFFMASNSDTPLVRELYEGFDIHTVQARRNINSKGDKRGPINELVIVGGP